MGHLRLVLVAADRRPRHRHCLTMCASSSRSSSIDDIASSCGGAASASITFSSVLPSRSIASAAGSAEASPRRQVRRLREPREVFQALRAVARRPLRHCTRHIPGPAVAKNRIYASSATISCDASKCEDADCGSPSCCAAVSVHRSRRRCTQTPGEPLIQRRRRRLRAWRSGLVLVACG